MRSPAPVLSLAVMLILMTGCGGAESARTVVAYVSVDQIYSEPILDEFSTSTGIEVRAVYDVEASKTTGLVNRLIAEAGRPRADVYWNGEFVQTMLLKKEGVLAPYAPPAAADVPAGFRDPDEMWTGVGGRVRVLLAGATAPEATGLRDLLSPTFPPQNVGIAYPLFGSSATHAAALYAAWGPDRARQFYEALRDRDVRVLDGNATVRDLVVSGELSLGLTDSDDACGAIARGADVRLILPDQDGDGTFLVPGSAALVAGGPNPEEGRALMDYLTSAATEQALMDSGFCQLTLRPGGPVDPCLPASDVRVMQAAAPAVGAQLETSREDLSEIFLR